MMNKLHVIGALVLACLGSLAWADPPEAINLRKTVTVDVVQKTKDAVVYIAATRMIQQRANPFGNDPFFQQFDFGQIINTPANSLGSGFLIHADGYLVTNNHVVDRARQISVELADGRKLPATLLSADAEADLAVLKIVTDKPFPSLELGDSSDLMIGEPVIAVGNPLGYSHSVSTGIVSAIHRDLKGPNGTTLGDLIQTDAAINPGNSGGPLLNAYGQVIGINTAIRGDAQNIGFAIQVNKLRDIIPALMNPSAVSKVDVPVKLSEQRKVVPPSTIQSTVMIKDDKTPIVAINGHKPRDIVDAYSLLLKIKPGEKLNLELDKGASKSLVAKAVERPNPVNQAREKLGITVEPLTPEIADRIGLNMRDGLFVTEVARKSVAAKAGVQPGDVIFQLGPYPVSNLDDLATLVQHLPKSGRVRIGVIRDNQVGYGVLIF